MLKPDTASGRAPRGTKPVSQAFFAALESIPESSRSAVAKAAQAMIRDEIKARREKLKIAAAKEKARQPVAAKAAASKPVAAKASSAKAKVSKPGPAKRNAAKRALKVASPEVTEEAVEQPAPKRRGRKSAEVPAS